MRTERIGGQCHSVGGLARCSILTSWKGKLSCSPLCTSEATVTRNHQRPVGTERNSLRCQSWQAGGDCGEVCRIYQDYVVLGDIILSLAEDKWCEMATVKGLHPAFQHNYYLFRDDPFEGGTSFVYDESEKLRLYSKRKSFILEGDFRVLGAGRKELLTIKTPQPLGAWTTCYVQDSTTGEPVGVLRRSFFKSILRTNGFSSPAQVRR